MPATYRAKHIACYSKALIPASQSFPSMSSALKQVHPVELILHYGDSESQLLGKQKNVERMMVAIQAAAHNR